MSVILQLTPHDPLIARDGRPFGAGQGNRMRGLPWPLPSVVAGSFRTALVKSNPEWDFSWTKFKQEDLLKIAVAGVFPVHGGKLYLPAPSDCAWDDKTNTVHRVQPIPLAEGEGVDFPELDQTLWPVRLTAKQATEDFKAKNPPVWWPLEKYQEWLTSPEIKYQPNWFTSAFLNSAVQSMRDHVALDAERGAAAESLIFASSNLHLTHLPRFYEKGSEEEKNAKTFLQHYAEVQLSARVEAGDSGLNVSLPPTWHPLGGERRLVHWQSAESKLWDCPKEIRDALARATHVRMILATPAIFKSGWKPDLTNGPLKDLGLKLTGVSINRWKAVSGWDLVKRGPKPIRRMVPAGGVYFFVCEQGAAAKLAELWLQPVSDDDQARRDGFGLAVWGTWQHKENS